jgi:hypothetical protein
MNVYLTYRVCRWFEGFSWEFIQKGTLVAPFVPKVNDRKTTFVNISLLLLYLFSSLSYLSIILFKVEHDADTSNFDTFAEDDSPEPQEDLTGWDKEF